MLAVLSKAFNWAEARGYRPEHSNPCRLIEKFPERRRERFLSELELDALGAALRQAEENGESPFVVGALRLLVLTGARLSEILTLHWSNVDIQAGVLRLPTSKTGPKTVYLSPPALTVLANLPRLSGNPHVICGAKEGAHLINLQKPWRRIRDSAALPNVRIHDLRHSFASVAIAAGNSLTVIGRLLGHTQVQTTARYAHLSADPVKAAGDQTANRIDAAMAKKSNDGTNKILRHTP